MTEFSVNPTWLEGADPEEGGTFAEIALTVAEGAEISGLFDPESGTTASGPRMPAALLASGVADHWWQLLYEPQKGERDPLFEARHRLKNTFTRGYVFTPLAIWSGGETVILNLSGLTLGSSSRFSSCRIVIPVASIPG